VVAAALVDGETRPSHRYQPCRDDAKRDSSLATLVYIVRILVNDPFKAIAHPIRRGIVERLVRGPATVGEATAGFGVSKPAITRHVRVLEEAGVVVRTVEGRTHRLGLDLDALSEPVEWFDRQRALWDSMFDAVDEYLEQRGETR
jgi:DNA-binding transcriptional ArsR family regulator